MRNVHPKYHVVDITPYISDHEGHFIQLQVYMQSTKKKFHSIKAYTTPTYKPDLVSTDIWVDSSGDKIYYTVKNNGECVAQAGHQTSLSVDNTEVANVTVPIQLAFGESYTGSFEEYTWYSLIEQFTAQYT